MKDKEWCKGIEDELNRLMGRVKDLEGGSSSHRRRSRHPETIELEIVWPEADIGGLHFNAQKTRNVFELKEDGDYYSRDILIHSARDTDEGTGRDLLSEYLDSKAVKEAFFSALVRCFVQVNIIRVFLPEDNQGIKKYNGVTCGYWLKPRYSGSTSTFTYVYSDGSPTYYHANVVRGIAPAFCVR
jgi:hypothetical protein